MNNLIFFRFFPFSAWQFGICHLFPLPSFILPSPCVTTLERNWPLDSDGIGVVPKLVDVWVITAPPKLTLIPKVLFHRVLTETFCQYKLHTFLEKELGTLNCRMDCDFKSLMCLPGQEHSGSVILGIVTRSVLNAGFPWLQVLQKLHQEFKSIRNKVFRHHKEFNISKLFWLKTFQSLNGKLCESLEMLFSLLTVSMFL